MKYALCKTFLCSLQTIKSLNRNTFPRKCVIASHEFAAFLCLRLHYHAKLFGSTIVGLLKDVKPSSLALSLTLFGSLSSPLSLSEFTDKVLAWLTRS